MTFTCSGGSSTSASTCDPICGDGKVFSPETCDDNDIGCNSTCTGSKEGWTCSGGTTTSASTCSTICGDGLVLGSETCDDSSNDL